MGEHKLYTVREAAKVLGVSKTTVEQTEKRALAKLKRLLEAQGLTLEDFLDFNREDKKSSFPDSWEG